MTEKVDKAVVEFKKVMEEEDYPKIMSEKLFNVKKTNMKKKHIIQIPH